MVEGKPKKKLKRPKVAQPDGVAYPELENVLKQMAQLQVDGLNNKMDFLRLEEWALKFLEERGLETYDRGPFRGTPVPGSIPVYDWEAIQKKIGPRLWAQILAPPQPDPDKLAALIELQMVKASDIDPLIEDKPKKTYLKITRREL